MKSLPILSIFILLFISCQQSDKKVISAEFNINKLLLSDSSFVSKTGFSITPPKEWTRTGSYNFELQKKASWTGTLFGLQEQVSTTSALFALPIALWEFSLGVYLVVKGFKPSPVTAGI